MSTDGFGVLQREGIYSTPMIHKYALCKSNHRASIIPGILAAASVVNLLLLRGDFNFSLHYKPEYLCWMTLTTPQQGWPDSGAGGDTVWSFKSYGLIHHPSGHQTVIFVYKFKIWSGGLTLRLILALTL